jgi:hypothetical protein
MMNKLASIPFVVLWWFIPMVRFSVVDGLL